MKCVLTDVCLVSAAFQSSGTCQDPQTLVPYFFLSLHCIFWSSQTLPHPSCLYLPSLFLPLSLCQSQLQAEDLSFVNNSQVD